MLAGPGGDIYEFQKEHHTKKDQVRVQTSPETRQLVKEMCPLDSYRLLFKLAVEQGMVVNVWWRRGRLPTSNSMRYRDGASRWYGVWLQGGAPMGKKRANGEGSIRKPKDGRWEMRYTAGYDPETGMQTIRNVPGKTQAESRHAAAKATPA